MDLQLKGKRALVTGSSSGIGAAIARVLAGEGCSVVVTGRNAERTATVAEGIRATGADVASAVGDLATDDGAETVAAAAIEAFGGIDILVNNAGGATVGTLAKLPDSAWHESFATNFFGPVALSRLAAHEMERRGGGAQDDRSSDARDIEKGLGIVRRVEVTDIGSDADNWEHDRLRI